MAQYSVYIRFVGSKEKSEKYVRSVKNKLPPWGESRYTLFFTDKQYENIISFDCREQKSRQKKARSIHPILGLRAVFYDMKPAKNAIYTSSIHITYYSRQENVVNTQPNLS